jgi:hypothetical protein
MVDDLDGARYPNAPGRWAKTTLHHLSRPGTDYITINTSDDVELDKPEKVAVLLADPSDSLLVANQQLIKLEPEWSGWLMTPDASVRAILSDLAPR